MSERILADFSQDHELGLLRMEIGSLNAEIDRLRATIEVKAGRIKGLQEKVVCSD